MTEANLSTPSSSTIDVVKAATACLRRIYREDIHYKRAGVVLMGVVLGIVVSLIRVKIQ